MRGYWYGAVSRKTLPPELHRRVFNGDARGPECEIEINGRKELYFQ
jgi:hypothetical protein